MSAQARSEWVVAACALAASTALAGWAQTGSAEATVKATGPAGFKILGKASKVAVADDGAALTVTVNVKDVDTDNGLRNSHMQEDLEADRFPLITMKVPLASLEVPAEGQAVDAVGKGVFGIHGQTREVPFKYKAWCRGGVCAVDASAEVSLKDFGVKIRSYLGITVRPDIFITAKFQVKQ